MDNVLVPIGALVAVLAIALLGVWQFGGGLDQKGLLAAGNPISEAERHARRPLGRLDRALARTALGHSVGRRIAAAGVHVRVSTFLLALCLVAVGAVVGAWRWLAPVFGVAASVVVVWAFLQYLRQMEERRKEAFIGQLPELARVLSNAFSAGLALRTAVEMAAEELDDPARTELQITAHSLQLGQPTEQALADLRDRLPSRELSVLVSTLIISARAGGSMVTALRNLSNTLEARKEVRREVKTTLAQAVYTGYLIAVMGVGMLFLVNHVVPDGLAMMTSNPLGLIVLAISCSLFAIGVGAVNRMSRVDL
ncbi:MAG: hypothetical protein GEV04_18185 [Actinophytocola sp.]|nr:hypothetical protein [Actinophytocola sp.]